MRAEGIANIRDIELAVLETNGNVSVIDKKDADVSEIIISDGEFDTQVIKRLRLTKKEVLKAIKEKSEKELFLVMREKDGKYYKVKRDCK